eukprot:3694080-Pyramimonas_sp.AAC.1
MAACTSAARRSNEALLPAPTRPHSHLQRVTKTAGQVVRAEVEAELRERAEHAILGVTRALPEGGEAEVGVVRAEVEAKLRARAEHAVGLGGAAPREVVHQHADVRLRP